MRMDITNSSPVRGEGPRAQRVVEGAGRMERPFYSRSITPYPSTSLRLVPLPVPGRIG